jgi:uncharacterized membrane protein
MDSAYLLDWLNLVVRWSHLIVGIAWIGSSFYFVWLDDSLEPTEDGDPSKLGQLWSVHGGGFYNNVKFKGAPPQMPQRLHWFYWESYSTWITGFFLMCVLYYAGAETWLIDRSVADLSKAQAIGIGLAFLGLGWVVYDVLCRLLAGRDRLLGLAVALYCVVAAYALTHLFSGRGAFIHFGAMLATIMSANVFFVIIPGQRKTVAAIGGGAAIDPAWGGRAKQRSVHNTYFTLPVLFCMISNHYAMTYSGTHAWAALLAIALAGVLVRWFFVLKHTSPPRWGLLGLGLAVLALVAVALRPVRSPKPMAGTTAPAFAEVRRIVGERCTACHADRPTWPGFAAAPKGFVFDDDARIVRQAALIHQQAVVIRVMPIGNLTGITEAERSTLDAWFRAGAPGP